MNGFFKTLVFALAFFPPETTIAQVLDEKIENKVKEYILDGDYWSLERMAEEASRIRDKEDVILSSFSAYLSGNNEAALSFIQPLLQSSDEPAYLCLKARYLSAQGKFVEAIALLQNGHEQHKQAGLFANLASANLSLGQVDEAIAYSNEAIETDPNCVDALYFRGFALWKQGKHAIAIVDFEKAFAIRKLGPYKNEAQPYLLCGIFYANSGDKQKAVRILSSSLKDTPYSAPISKHVATLLWKLHSESNQEMDALAVAEYCIGLDPQLKEFKGLYAMSLINLKRLSDAETYLEQWLTLAPEDPRAYCIFAQVRLNQGKLYEALRQAEKSALLAKNDFEAEANLIKISLELVKSNEFHQVRKSKQEFANELCERSKQLCKLTNWETQKYVDLLSLVYRTFGRDDELATLQKTLR